MIRESARPSAGRRSAITIALANQKGGVGKTTTAVSLSVALAAGGYRVLLVDIDPQGNATSSLGIEKTDLEYTIYDLLVGNAPAQDVIVETGRERLQLLPSSPELAGAEVELVGVSARESRLKAGLDPVRDAYDLILVDCPPSLSILTLNALTAVNEVFLPLQPHFLALHGLSKLLRTIEVVTQRLNANLRLSGVVLCMYDSGTRLAAEVSADVHDFFNRQSATDKSWEHAQTFKTRIRRNIRLAEAPSFGQSIFEYAPQSHGAEDYRDLAREVLAIELEQRATSLEFAAA